MNTATDLIEQQNQRTMSLSDVFSFLYLFLLWEYFTYRLRANQRLGSAVFRRIKGLPPVGPAHRDLLKLVDLCLLRKTDELGQRVLPYGIRQLIKDFLGALDNASIRKAVKLWCEDREQAYHRYGHIFLWDTGRVTDMSELFFNQRSFNDDISKWDVSKVTTMREMFGVANDYNQPLEDWDVSSVTTMMCMFCQAYTFNQSLSKWNVSSVTDMAFMFAFTKAFNQPLNDWDVSRLQTTFSMFYNSKAFNQPLVSWNVASIPHKRDMIYNAVAFRQPETMEVWRAAGYSD